MPDVRQPLKDYIHSVQSNLDAGNATEHTHRPALKTLLESLGNGVSATNEPRRIECGAPDFVVVRGLGTVGYVEAKDVGKSLDEAERSDQLVRYRKALPNLVLTDYLGFRWYVNGERLMAARLGAAAADGNIRRDPGGVQSVAQLLAAFFSHEAEVAGTPKDLALRLARMAHMIRDLIVAAFDKEMLGGALHAQFSAFRDNLIPDLSAEQFADMYAQTIAYGLFAARCTTVSGKDFTRQNAAYLLPKTNPFLRKLFNHIAGPDLDDRIAWLVDDLAWVLARADMESILRDFGKRTAKEDPVVHFYETFLAAYDPKVREMRGVYYTPVPVVSYIVRSVDHLLKTRFARSEGLADANTLILDPAVGTATFLYAVIKEVNETMGRQGQQGMWNDYVADKLLPRLFGFELLMAPYAVAHLKLGLLLQETGYRFQSDQRLGIYLTNTLEEAIKRSEALFASWISEEANAAAEIKKEKPIMVVLGNPPYSGISANKGGWIARLIKDYKSVDGAPLGERKTWLQDDYVKFMRFGQWRITSTGEGILAFVTNHGYLENPTFRGMRQSLMNSFSDIYVLNLHGGVKKREVGPEGDKDENVFDIQQGVAIGIFVKSEGKRGPATVRYAELWGGRGTKYEALFSHDVQTTRWEQLEPSTPDYLFARQGGKAPNDWQNAWALKDVFCSRTVGIVTARDNLTIRWSTKDAEDTVRDFAQLAEDEARDKYKLGPDARDWKVASAQKDVKKSGLRPELISAILYRPFDVRFTFYSGQSRGFIGQPQQGIMRHMLRRNTCLICPRRVETSGSW